MMLNSQVTMKLPMFGGQTTHVLNIRLESVSAVLSVWLVFVEQVPGRNVMSV